MRVGSRTANSSVATLKSLFPRIILKTFAFYGFSAWCFLQVYLWSSSADAQLEQVLRGRYVEERCERLRLALTEYRSHERPLLNERPIYLYTFHLLLACTQAVAHLYNDYDRVSIPITQRNSNSEVPPTLNHIRASLPKMIIAGLKRTAILTGCLPVVYLFLLRRTAWSWALYFAKLSWNFPRSASEPDTWIPPHFPYLIMRTLVSGSWLVICWQSANVFFSVFIGKEPLKRGRPLTEESKDPNGSLLTGLKAKKPEVKAFAFWELSLITQRLPERRKAIFNEIDRDSGATWSQVFSSTTEIIKTIAARIEASKAVMPAPEPATKALVKSEPVQPTIQTLPRLTSALKDEGVFAASPKATSHQDKFGEAFSSAAKSYGQSPDWTPKARARARLVFDRASAVILTPERKEKLLASDGFKLFSNAATAYKPENYSTVTQFLRSPLGQPLRQTFARRASRIVLGTPESSLCVIVDAVQSLTRLLVASLTEDQYGKVQTDVPSAIRLFTDTIMTTEAFVYNDLGVHWTDVNFASDRTPESQLKARKVPEVEFVLDALRSGLKDLLTSFKPYLQDINIQGKDLRLARAAAGIDGDEQL